MRYMEDLESGLQTDRDLVEQQRQALVRVVFFFFFPIVEFFFSFLLRAKQKQFFVCSRFGVNAQCSL
jgi:hypothetical protein